MDFEWDEAKRRRVLRDRTLDFLDAPTLFDGRNLLTVPSPRSGEERWLSIGELDGRSIAVIWMWRDGAIRIVTMRRARHEETRKYRQAFG
jgi:uncharacterized DUF497 family protein